MASGGLLTELPGLAWELIVQALQPTSAADCAASSLALPLLCRELYESRDLAQALAGAVGFRLTLLAPGLRDEALALRAARQLARAPGWARPRARAEYIPRFVKSVPARCLTKLVAAQLLGIDPSLTFDAELEQWRRDRDVVLQVLTMLPYPPDTDLLCYFPAFQSDRGVVLAAVSRCGAALASAPTFKADREVALAAVASEAGAAMHVAFALLEDASFVQEAVGANREALLTLGPWLSYEQARLAVHLYPTDGLACLPQQLLKRRPELWRTALKLDARAIAYAPREQLTREDVLEAVRRSPQSLLGLEVWREDRALLSEALSRDGMLLARMDLTLRYDRALVLAAVTQNGMALEFVPRPVADKAMVLAALRSNGLALAFTRDEYRGCETCVSVATKQNPSARYFSKMRRC